MTARIGWRALARYLARESTPEEAASIEAWEKSNGKNAETLSAARRAWDSAGLDPARFDVDRAWHSLADRIAGSDELPFTRGVPSHARWRKPAAWATALLAAAIAFALIVPAVRNRTDSPAARVYATGAANTSTVHLDDGSIVRLAPSSELRVDPNGKREAWLKGTGFFAIAKKDGEPFVVHTPAGDARVLGTRFELSTAGREVRLVVFEGRVALTASGGSEIVEAGHVSSLEKDGAPVPARRADVQNLAPWMDDVLIFQATPLGTVAVELERQFGKRIHVADDQLSNRTVSAVFDHQSLETVVAAICRVTDATCEIQDSAVLIRP